MMKLNDFISKLRLAHDVPNYYCNKFPKNCGYFDGTRYSFDCWNLIKCVLANPSWEPTGVKGSYVSPKNFVTGDCDGYHLLMQCTNRSKDFSKLSQPGTYLYLSTSPHAGVYLGDFVQDGYTFNVVECTGAWESKVQYTYVDKNGGRYLYKGGPKSQYSWTDYGLLTPYVDYNEVPEPEPVPFSAFAIDVSRYQRGLSLRDALAQGFDHVIMRIGGADGSGGTYYKDPCFDDFYRQAKECGFKIAAYYLGYAFNTTKAAEEATNCLSLLANTDIKTVFYDVEGGMLNQSKASITDNIVTFCSILNGVGYNCGIYSSESHFNSKFDDARLSNLYHWVARYLPTAPVLKSGNKVDMWQFGGSTNYFRSPLISGIKVDQNIMFKEWDSDKGYYINGYDYSPVFDPEYYSNKYPDLKAAFGENKDLLWNHFCQFGMYELRQGSAEFDPVFYKGNNPDVVQAFGDDNPMYYLHYVAFGKAEGRKGAL